MKRGDPKILDYYARELEGLKEFYEVRKDAYRQYVDQPYVVSGVNSTTVVSTIPVRSVDGEDEYIRATSSSKLIAELHEDMPPKLCSFWESFIKDCKGHFNFPVKEFHNAGMKEIFLVRNCLLHNKRIADDPYITQTELKKFEKDELVILRAKDIYEFFGYLEDTFEGVKQKIEVVEEIRGILKEKDLVLVGIDGLGGAGKSTVAKHIKGNIPNTTIIEMDDFYIPELTRLDWDRVAEQVIEPLKNNLPARYQRFDWETKQLAEWHTVKPVGVVVVEGVYALHEKLRNAYDYKIWVEAPYDLRLKRGLERDGQEARSWWENDWMPKEEEYKQSQKPHEIADILIDGTN